MQWTPATPAQISRGRVRRDYQVGMRRLLEEFFWLRVFPVVPRRHPRLSQRHAWQTHTVGRSVAINNEL